MKADHVLLVGFGAPEKVEDVRAFLAKVAEGRAIPEERLSEVEHHYAVIGGSPYNRHALEFKRHLEEDLRERGLTLPVYLGMRNWHPFMGNTLTEIASKGHCAGIGVILSVQRSISSCARYKDDVAQAKKSAGAEGVDYAFLPPWYDHPYFIEAQTDLIRKLLGEKKQTVEETHFLFTVHSIPVDMAKACDLCDYREEFNETARLTAERLGAPSWSQAYQSRSGSPRQPWLEPDILDEIKRLVSEGKRKIVVVPAGFLFDNAEVLFDLDVEAGDLARSLGIGYHRAPTVMGHPLMRKLFADLIQKTAASDKQFLQR
ncbi:MAG: ferrochelatase [Candidatus Omnitrophica bacterium]|nr:ferrochelatase [Candidatus Omnitrophota bacterium]